MNTQRTMPSKMRDYLQDGSPIKDRDRHRVEQGSWIFDAEKNDLIAILDNLPVGIAILGSPFGNALYINRQLVATLGYTLLDTPSTRVLLERAMPDPETRREAVRLWKQTVKSGGGSRVVQRRCADGRVGTFEQKAVVLRKDLIVNMWMDVTRRETAEAQLRESELRFRSFFEKSTDPFLLLNGNRVINCNLAALQIFNHRNKEQIIGTTIEDLSPEKQPDGCLSSKQGAHSLKSCPQTRKSQVRMDSPKK